MPEKYYIFPHKTLVLTSGYDLRVLGSLQAVHGISDIDILISIPQIYYNIKGRGSPSHDSKKSIEESLERLYGCGVIYKNEAGYIFNSKLLRESTPYEQCNKSAFEKLIDSPELLLHYLNISRGRIYSWSVDGSSRVICRKTLETLSSEENVSRDSIIRYNAKLENLNLIYIGKGKFDGEKRECNVYSLYEDRKYVDSYIGSFSNKDSRAADIDRSVSQRYNRYKKNPEKYTLDQARCLFEDVTSYNNRMIERGKVQPDYLKNIKDLSIIIVD